MSPVAVGWLWLLSAVSTQLHVSPIHVIFPSPILDLSAREEGGVQGPLLLALRCLL